MSSKNALSAGNQQERLSTWKIVIGALIIVVVVIIVSKIFFGTTNNTPAVVGGLVAYFIALKRSKKL